MDIAVGERFPSKVALRTHLFGTFLRSGRPLKIVRSKRNSITVKCREMSCNFRLVAGKLIINNDHVYEVRSFVAHNCARGLSSELSVDLVPWLAKYLAPTLTRNPSLDNRETAAAIFRDLHIRPSIQQMQRACRSALKNLYGTDEESYKMIRSLLARFLEVNHNSLAVVEASADGHFIRLAIGFAPCIAHLHAGALIFLDGTHLRKGVALTCVYLDSNRHRVPLAVAIVQSESEDSWSWFLSKLHERFQEFQRPLSIMSDRDKGLANAIESSLPLSYGFFCVFHIKNNLPKMFHSGEIASLFISASLATNLNDFNVIMDQISKRL